MKIFKVMSEKSVVWIRSVVQMARTFALGAKGRGFKSRRSDMGSLFFLTI